MYDKTTAAVATIIKGSHTNLRDLSRQTGIAYGVLRRSLTYQARALRADEFLILCRALELDPVTFAPQEKRLGEEVE